MRIDGIAEGPNGRWEQCAEQLQNVLEWLGLASVQNKRAQRVSWLRQKGQTKNNRLWGLISQTRKKVLKSVKKLKDTNNFINKDICHKIVQHREELCEEVKQRRSEDQTAY